MWQVQITRRSKTKLALKNKIFEDKACRFTQNTLERKKEKQSSHWVSPPQLAGVLKASPPRIKGKVLERPLPMKIRHH
jgi:hypothetical protein